MKENSQTMPQIGFKTKNKYKKSKPILPVASLHLRKKTVNF